VVTKPEDKQQDSLGKFNAFFKAIAVDANAMPKTGFILGPWPNISEQ